MAYSLDVCALLTGQLQKLVSLNRHQLVGQLANLDFWLSEVQHAVTTIDGYRARFKRMKAAQEAYVTANKVIEFDLQEPYVSSAAARPVRLNNADLAQSRRNLVEAWRRFLVRCCNEHLLDMGRARENCERVGISLEPEDLQHP